MPINVFEESVMTLTEAATLLPRRRRGRKPHPTCLYRWAQAGLRSASGIVVRLETVKVGGTTCTSKEALQRFFDRLQDNSPPVISPAYRTSRSREAEIRQAERGLRIMGLAGDGHIFATSIVSKDRLCELHEYIEKKMPHDRFKAGRAYVAIRSGIFEHAVRILEGKAGRRSSMEAAKEWVDGLDLLTMDVSQLHGIGPVYVSEWMSLLQDPVRRALLDKPGDAGG